MLLRLVPWWAYVLVFGMAVTVGTGMYLSHVRAIKKTAHAAGVEQDRARSHKVIAKLQSDALAAAIDAEKNTQALEEAWRSRTSGAQRELDKALARNRLVSAALAERDQLRDDRARTSVVTGGVQASDDSVAACRIRTERTWISLEAALRTSRECAGDASDSDEGIRSLQAAWPVSDAIR